MSSLIDIFYFIGTLIVTLGAIILVHELGHFISARIFGCRVEEFGMGIPPRICGIKKVPSFPKATEDKPGLRVKGKKKAAASAATTAKTVAVEKAPVSKKWQFFWGNKEPNKKDRDSTIYSLNYIPLGGFCKITGAGEGDSIDVIKDRKDPKNFNSKPAWQRTIILLAGVTMNLSLRLFDDVLPSFWSH